MSPNTSCRNSYPTDLECAYAAGLFDGEGSIHISVGHKLQVQLANSDLAVMEWVQERWGGSLYELGPNLRQLNARQFWHLAWNSAEDRSRLLNDLLPYLIVKHKAAEIALRFIATIGIPPSFRKAETITAEREALRLEWVALYKFNLRRGVEVASA